MVMAHPGQTIQESWNAPDVMPGPPGEYLAALDPMDVAPGTRRWWNGDAWSNPYSTSWPMALKEKIRKEVSPFILFWRPV